MRRVDPELHTVIAGFDLPGDFVLAEHHGSGHINDSFVSTFDQAGARVRYLHQRINHRVFQDVPRLMQNVERVTRHQRARLEAQGARDASRRAIRLVPTLDGQPFLQSASGHYWRTYLFIERARTFDLVETTAQAREAARAFGAFQLLLADLDGARLHEVIPGFHDTPRRFAALEEAIGRDERNRAAGVRAEIDFALARRGMCSRLIDLHHAGRLPERVTHNDTKLNNVMLDDATGEGICVIDLDTCMPGFALYDFGDMVRTATNAAAEDERDLEKVVVRMPMFEALVQGFLDAGRATFTRDEVDQLAFSGRLMTFECGVRFLTDYLNGDVYFRIHREQHNLDRCRTQFRLVKEMERLEDDMERVVGRHR